MNKEARAAATPYPCGRCLPCRINQRRVWTHRILLEQLCHGDSIWCTLTYEKLLNPPNVNKKEVQNFLKRLRKITPKFRYFIVGEYGFEGKRKVNPHYHACFFGLSIIYSQVIFETWGKCKRDGFFVGQLNERTAQYTAGYTTSKLTKRKEMKQYGLEDEFMLSSRKNGGIGYPAIVQIASKWKDSKWNDQRIIRELRKGRIEAPLGRYLTTKLNELLDIPQSKMDTEYWIHQEEIFDKHMRGNGLDYIESLLKEDETKYYRQQKKFKMWKNRKL